MKEKTDRIRSVSLGLLWIVLWLTFCSGLSQAGTVTYSYDEAGRLIKATYGDETQITYTYDGAGNLLSRVTGPPSQDTTMVLGWNLLSIYKDPTDNGIEAILGNTVGKVVSVWKWQGNTWAVYLPGEGTEAYATSKGFSVLQNLNAGEGFWINSNEAQKLSVNGSAPADETLNVAAGWNLLGLKSSQGKGVSQLITGKEGEILSIWKWESNNWAVYLPGQDDGGAAYAQSKGFILLDQIDPGEGFWVNCTGAVTLE